MYHTWDILPLQHPHRLTQHFWAILLPKEHAFFVAEVPGVVISPRLRLFQIIPLSPRHVHLLQPRNMILLLSHHFIVQHTHRLIIEAIHFSARITHRKLASCQLELSRTRQRRVVRDVLLNLEEQIPSLWWHAECATLLYKSLGSRGPEMIILVIAARLARKSMDFLLEGCESWGGVLLYLFSLYLLHKLIIIQHIGMRVKLI